MVILKYHKRFAVQHKAKPIHWKQLLVQPIETEILNYPSCARKRSIQYNDILIHYQFMTNKLHNLGESCVIFRQIRCGIKIIFHLCHMLQMDVTSGAILLALVPQEGHSLPTRRTHC